MNVEITHEAMEGANKGRFEQVLGMRSSDSLREDANKFAGAGASAGVWLVHIAVAATGL